MTQNYCNKIAFTNKIKKECIQYDGRKKTNEFWALFFKTGVMQYFGEGLKKLNCTIK